MTKQELSIIKRLQRKACKMLNQLGNNISQEDATDFTSRILFDPTVNTETLQEIISELKAF